MTQKIFLDIFATNLSFYSANKRKVLLQIKNVNINLNSNTLQEYLPYFKVVVLRPF